MALEQVSQEQAQLPFFVYGTLRPGQHNYSVAEDFVVGTTPARLPSAAMWTNGAFPYVVTIEEVPSVPEEGVVYGDLLHIDPDIYDIALNSMDFLEGISTSNDRSGHYQRRQVTVQTGEGEVEAWIYVAGTAAAFRCAENLLPRVESGDWLQRFAVRA